MHEPVPETVQSHGAKSAHGATTPAAHTNRRTARTGNNAVTPSTGKPTAARGKVIDPTPAPIRRKNYPRCFPNRLARTQMGRNRNRGSSRACRRAAFRGVRVDLTPPTRQAEALRSRLGTPQAVGQSSAHIRRTARRTPRAGPPPEAGPRIRGIRVPASGAESNVPLKVSRQSAGRAPSCRVTTRPRLSRGPGEQLNLSLTATAVQCAHRNCLHAPDTLSNIRAGPGRNCSAAAANQCRQRRCLVTVASTARAEALGAALARVEPSGLQCADADDVLGRVAKLAMLRRLASRSRSNGCSSRVFNHAITMPHRNAGPAAGRQLYDPGL